MIKDLAKHFCERATALELRGVTRDKAALEFFLGAATALTLAGKEREARPITTFAALIVATRGYAAVAELAFLDDAKRQLGVSK